MKRGERLGRTETLVMLLVGLLAGVAVTVGGPVGAVTLGG